MRPGAVILAIALLPVVAAPGSRASFFEDGEVQTARQLSLADLAGYRAALSGRPTADLAKASDAPVQVKFRDLWNRQDVFRGRRITIDGQVARIFRQGPVGSFPPLAEVWITSPVGDPFCVVCPQPQSAEVNNPAVAALEERKPELDRTASLPEIGKSVRFTGTFLKMVRYTGGDGARLAPLIVGDRLPVASAPNPAFGHISNLAGVAETHGSGHPGGMLRLSVWVMGLLLAAVGAMILARWHLRRLAQPATGRESSSPRASADDPLEFVEPNGES
jgi:hypothetical protein